MTFLESEKQENMTCLLVFQYWLEYKLYCVRRVQYIWSGNIYCWEHTVLKEYFAAF